MGFFNFGHNRNSGANNSDVADGIIGEITDDMISTTVVDGKPYITCTFPNGTKSLSANIRDTLKRKGVERIVVPGTLTTFKLDLSIISKLKQVVIENGVEVVDCNVAPNLIDFKLPSTIEKLGAHNYPMVENLIIPKGVKTLGNNFASHDLCLKSVIVPGTVKTVPTYAFNQCRYLESVVFEEGVSTSVYDAFHGTNNLKTLVLPSTYNGIINLDTEERHVSTAGGNYRYDAKNLANELEQQVKIQITRGTKKFEFNFRRGDQPKIEIIKNLIKVSIEQETININCETLEAGAYKIENGKVTKIDQAKTSNGESREKQIRKTFDAEYSIHKENDAVNYSGAIAKYICDEVWKKFINLSIFSTADIEKIRKFAPIQINRVHSEIASRIENALYDFDSTYKSFINDNIFVTLGCFEKKNTILNKMKEQYLWDKISGNDKEDRPYFMNLFYSTAFEVFYVEGNFWDETLTEEDNILIHNKMKEKFVRNVKSYGYMNVEKIKNLFYNPVRREFDTKQSGKTR